MEGRGRQTSCDGSHSEEINKIKNSNIKLTLMLRDVTWQKSIKVIGSTVYNRYTIKWHIKGIDKTGHMDV